jgi:hypothetical protein
MSARRPIFRLQIVRVDLIASDRILYSRLDLFRGEAANVIGASCEPHFFLLPMSV